MMHAQSDIARLLIPLSKKTSGPRPKTPNCSSYTHKWVESGCRLANSFSAAVWAVETGLHGAFPMYVFALDGIARWRLLERKRSPAIREVTPTELPLSRLHPASARHESLSTTELPPSWPMFDPSQYWAPQASLDFLPGLAPSPVAQMQVQQSPHPPRAAIPIPPSGGGDFRAAPSMISAYRYPASFDPVFTSLGQPQGLPYNETSGIPMQTDILELQTNITSDPDTRSDSSSASAVRRDVEMEPALINRLNVRTREEEDNSINEHSLEYPDGTGSDYDDCRLLSPPLGDISSESVACSPVTASPVEKPSHPPQPAAETSPVDRGLPRLSSTLATSSE
jgi:hypothetical protein